MAGKLDLKKQLGKLYAPPSTGAALVTVPRQQLLAITGAGDPNNSAQWQSAMETLYGLSYTIKFSLKKRGATPDYGVMPLEALWRLADGIPYSPDAPRELWRWTAFIVQPDFVTADDVDAARVALAKKKPEARPSDAILDSMQEGLAAQIMHLGPYAEEWPTIERLHAFIAEQGFTPRMDHHEIYLSDPGRTAPAKMKTILRQPVTR